VRLNGGLQQCDGTVRMTHAKLIVERGLRPFLLLLTSATWLACGDDSSSAAGSGGAAGAPLGGGGSGAAGSGGASVNFAACDQPTDCGLVQPGCCPICELPTLADVEPIDIALAEAFYESTCNGVDLCACDGLVNPNLYAVCNAGTCEKADVRESDLSSCASAKECVLRAGLDCCACNAEPDAWVAIAAASEAALSALVCGTTECDACEPVPPAGLGVDCVSGHCEVVAAP
jgi:hypothetical protein